MDIMYIVESALSALTNMGVKDWLAVYAAVLSTIIAIVQVINVSRDRPRLRVRVHREKQKNSREQKRFYIIVSVANKGRHQLAVYPPTIEVAQDRSGLLRIIHHSPDYILDDYNWRYWDDDGEPPAPLRLEEGASEAFRYEILRPDKVLSVRIVDSLGDVRFRKKMFFGPWHRVLFSLCRLSRMVAQWVTSFSSKPIA